jgi:hypothetical protein
MAKAAASCFMFDWQLACRAFSLALANTGKRMAARTAMIAMTTSNSVSVKPLLDTPVALPSIAEPVQACQRALGDVLPRDHSHQPGAVPP